MFPDVTSLSVTTDTQRSVGVRPPVRLIPLPSERTQRLMLAARSDADRHAFPSVSLGHRTRRAQPSIKLPLVC